MSWKYEVDEPAEARTSLPRTQDIAPAPGDTLYVQGRPRDGTGIVVRLYRDGEVIREDQRRSLAILSYVVED